MSELNGIYRCETCGNIISVMDNGSGTLVCCAKPMAHLQEKTAVAEGKEKHVPIMSIDKDMVTVKVGSIPHPMDEKHHISLIQLMQGDIIITGKRLRPTDKPEAIFTGIKDTKELRARALCNLHGLWVSG